MRLYGATVFRMPWRSRGRETGRCEGFEESRLWRRGPSACTEFLPDADVNSNRRIDHQYRSFGEDHASRRLGGCYVKGARSGGMLRPSSFSLGHGDTELTRIWRGASHGRSGAPEFRRVPPVSTRDRRGWIPSWCACDGSRTGDGCQSRSDYLSAIVTGCSKTR